VTRRQIEIGAFALGWFLALGFLARDAFTWSSRVSYTHLTSLLHTLGRQVAGLEADAARSVRGGDRAARVRERFPSSSDLSALRSPKTFLWGAYDGGFPESMEGFARLERELGTFPLVSFYQAWGDLPEHQFPESFVAVVDRMGSVPVLTWEPWLSAFDPELWPHLPPPERRDVAGLAAIARGDYDFHVVRWARAAAAWGKPLFLRFAHEMNDPYRYPWGPQNGNRAEDFLNAWRHVHHLFQKMGAANVLWVFSPHPSMPWFEYYYPGDEVVDWVGMGVLNYGNVASWARWWHFEDVVGRAYPVLASFGKPIMITELGTVLSGGDPERWYARARAPLQEHYPQVKAAILFHQTHDDTLGGLVLNWSPLSCRGCVSTLRAWIEQAEER
jgi:hypothetical protein